MRYLHFSAAFARSAVLALVALAASVSGAAAGTDDVAAVLDELHAAASAADESRYFALFAPDGVFMGTAAEERWTVEQFRAYAHPHFSQGRGWTYVARPGERYIVIGPGGTIAWFDELLDNAKYGECRGSGVLRKIDGAWKIAHYNLTIPIPNEIALDVVGMIRDSKGDAPGD
jgi:uncharacterized protein (TIGR02246 family)